MDVQSHCETCIKNWLESAGSRNAQDATKQALTKLIQKFPDDSLPRRYLARLLFHEAAGAISPGTVGSNSSLQRIQLLTDAYEHAAVATDLSPNSLSCAALRATLAINLLVEESALLTPSPTPAISQPGAGAGSSSSKAVSDQQPQQQPSSCTMLDRKCQELLQRFLGSIDACRTALEHPNPVLREPLITFTTATHTTCDPCSLLVEKIMDCSRAGKLQEVVAEKRSVLTSMQQVLQSCYALLDSTQVPLHSIIRLLQHILRPYGAEQQMLASSRVNSSSPGGPGSSHPAPQLPASQLHHAAIGELLRLLRPGSNQPYANATAAAAAGAASASNAASAAAAVAATAPAALTCEAAAARSPADADLAPLPLSVEKPWEPPSTLSNPAGGKAVSGNARGAAKGRAGRGRAGAGTTSAGKKRERSRRERFMDVESFWRSCSPQQRLQLLRVPLAPLLAGVKQESGAPAAEVLMEGLVLLREQEHTSCYWLCAACDRKFHTARDFNTHLETCHEQLVLSKQQYPGHLRAVAAPLGPPAAAVAGKAPLAPQHQLPAPLSNSALPPPTMYVTCGKCQAHVVGMYYTRVPPHKQAPPPPPLPAGDEEAFERMRNICIKCYRELTTLMGEAGAERSYSRVTPHALRPTRASGSSGWSDSGSDFVSTRDSFSSRPDEGGSSESVSDTEPAATAAARSMQQCDSGCLGESREQHHGLHAAPDGCKPRGVPCPPWRFQQQRALAWRTHVPDAVPGSSRHTGTVAGRSGEMRLTGQQQQAQQQASMPPPSAGIFVFGSNNNSSVPAGSSSSSSTAGPGSCMPSSPVPAALAAAGPSGPSSSGTAATAGAGQMQPAAPSPCSSNASSSLVNQQQQQQQPQQGDAAGRLGAYWQQQQLLLCSTDAAAAELLDGLDIVQRAKQLNSKQRRGPGPALSPRGHVQAGSSSSSSVPAGGGGQPFGPGPVTGSKRPASAATGTAGSSLALSAGMPAFPAPGAVSTGQAGVAADGSGLTASEAEAAAGGYDVSGGADTGTPSAGNRTWRDWLLPKKLLQWNDDDGAGLQSDESGLNSDDDGLDELVIPGMGQTLDEALGMMGRTAAAERARAHASRGGAEQGSSSNSTVAGGCPPQQQQQQQPGRRWPAGEGAEADPSEDPGVSGEGGAAAGAPASAPCSPRTPSARDSCRGGGDTGCSSSAIMSDSSSAAAAAVCAVTRDPAAAAAVVAGGSDSLNAALAAAAPAVLVEEVMRCMQHLYDSDADVADETLLCLIDFLQRKLNPKGYRRVNCDGAAAAVLQASRRSSVGVTLQLEQVSPAAAAAAGAAGLAAEEAALTAELLAAPELAFMCPRAMRAAMCCLSSSDLHMALAYIVRQSGAPLAGVSVEIDSTCGSSGGGCSLASSSGAGSVSGEDLGDTNSQSDSEESDEESGCMCLLQLYHLDEVAFEELVGQLWPGELCLQDGAAAYGAGAKGGKHLRSAMLQHGLQQAAGAAGKGSTTGTMGPRAQQQERLEPVLLVAPWWLEHLRQSSKQAKDQAGDAEADIRVLRWVYGNIESAQAEELSSRQASLRGGMDRKAALHELYEALAEAWRRMQRVADRQRRLEQLRSRVKAKFADVKAYEEAAQHGTSQQAAVFLDALRNSLSPAAPAAAPVLPTCPAPGSTAAAAADGTSAVDSMQQQQPPARAAAATALSPLMQLTTYMTKLAPLYLCEAAVAAVRSAPLLASEASQQYACALLERELAVLALMEAMLEHDVAVARQRLQAANDRLLAKRGTELASAEAEQAKLVAEGPASHRKKDLLDKATKETEHRQKLADVKTRIEAAKAAIAEDEALAASAELAAAEGTAALLHVQDLSRQMNMRLKTLQDFNAQLAALLPPLHAAAAAAAAAAANASQQQALPAAAASSTYGSPNSNSLDSSTSSTSPQGDSMPAPAAPGAFTDAHAEWTLRARRLECLMCRVLWVAETIRLFDSQYDTHGVVGGGSSGGPGAPAGAGAGAPAVAVQAVSGPGLTGPQGLNQARTTPADMLSASRWVKEQNDELDASFHAAAEELGLLRSRISQLACVDLTFEIHECALNYVCRRIEAAATAAQEMRSQQLLLELAAEEEAEKKAAAAPTKQQQQQQASAAALAAAAAGDPTDKDASSAGAASASAGAASAQQPAGKPSKGKKAKQEVKAAASKPTPKANVKQQSQQDEAAAAQALARQAAVERQQALEAARAAREAAIDAELEKRRQELLALEEAQEAELIRLAEEASLREQQALKQLAERECQKKEQAAREAAAAATAAVDAAPAATGGHSPLKEQQQQHGASPVGGQHGRGQAGSAAASKAQQGRQQGTAAAAAKAGAAAAPGTLAAEQAGAAAPRGGVQRTVQSTGPGAAGQQPVSRASGKQLAARPTIGSPVPSAAGASASKRQQQQQQAAAAAGVVAGAAVGKKGGRGGQAAAAGGGRGGKAGSAHSTPSKQQRSQNKQQERTQQQQQQQHPQPLPVLLDFGPTPAEAYAAMKQAAAAQHEDAHHQGSNMQQMPQEQQQQLQTAPDTHAAPTSSMAAEAVAAPGAEPFGLTAADAVVHMPASAANSSSHLALLSQGHDSLAQPLGICSSEPRSRFDSSSGALSAAPGSAFSATAGGPFALPPAGAAAAGGSGSQSFTADAPLTGFSPAPGGSSLLSLGSGHLQFQAAASEAVRTLSGPTSLISGLSGSAQAFGGQDLGLRLGLGSLSASRQGSAGLQGSAGGESLNLGSSGLSAVGSKGAAAMMLVAGGAAVAASAPLAAPGGHLLPPRPSLGAVVGENLLGPAVTSGLEGAGGIFAQAGGVTGLGMQLGGSSFGGLPSGLEPVSPHLGCSPAEDALHIQSIMSLLDDTGGSMPPAAPAGAAVAGRGARQGKKQAQGQQVNQPPQRQQPRQQRQKQQQQRTPSRGRNSPGPGVGPDAKSAPGRGVDLSVGSPRVAGSTSSNGDSSQPAANHSASSSMSSTLSPLRPPGLSATTGSLSSRPSSAGSTSTGAGDGMGVQRQPQAKQGAAQHSSSQLWGAPYASASGAQGHSSSGWGGAGGLGLDTAGVAAGAGAGQGGFTGAGLHGSDPGACGMMGAGAVWSGPTSSSQGMQLQKAADVASVRDQQRPASAGMAGYPSSAQAAQSHNAHMAAAAAAAAATAAVKQAHHQAAVAAAAAAACSQGPGLRGRSPGLAGLYPQGQDLSALFGGSRSSLLGSGGIGGMSAVSQGGGYFDTAGAFGSLTGGAMGGLSGGLGAAHAAVAIPGLGDVSGLWQQQQQAAAMRYQGGLGGLQQPLQQQQQLWSGRPPSAGGGQGVQW